MSEVVSANILTEIAARYAIRAVYHEDDAGEINPVQGNSPPPELLQAIEELRLDKTDQAGIRRLGKTIVVRTPLASTGALIWVTDGPLSSVHEQVTSLSKLALLVSPSPENNPVLGSTRSDVRTLAAQALAELPESRKKTWFKQASANLEARTGWGNVIILEMANSRLKRFYCASRDVSDRWDDMNAFLSGLTDEKRFISHLEASDYPSVSFYSENYGVNEFALYAPVTGFGLYVEADCAESDLVFVSDLLERRFLAPKTQSRAWRPVAIAMICLSLIVFALWPVPLLIGAPAQIRPALSELHVSLQEARLEDIRVQVGDVVKTGDVLAVFSSPLVDATKENASLDVALERLNAQQALGDGDLGAYELAQQRVEILALREKQATRHVGELTATAQISGRVADVVDHGQVGAILSVGSVIAEVQKSSEMNALLTLDPADGALVFKGMEGELLLRGVINQTYRITMREEPVLATGPDGQQLLTVLAEIHGEGDDDLYKGLSGFAQIEGKTGLRVVNFLRPLTEFIELIIWKYTGWRI